MKELTNSEKKKLLAEWKAHAEEIKKSLKKKWRFKKVKSW